MSAESQLRARAEEATRIVGETEEAERVEIRRAARLLRPTLAFVPDSSGYLDKSEVAMFRRKASRPIEVTLCQRLRLSGLPVLPGRTEPAAPEVLVWRHYDGNRWSVEPVAKLAKITGLDADYGLAHTLAARDFGAMLDCLGTATVQIRTPAGGGPVRTAVVVFDD